MLKRVFSIALYSICCSYYRTETSIWKNQAKTQTKKNSNFYEGKNFCSFWSYGYGPPPTKAQSFVFYCAVGMTRDLYNYFSLVIAHKQPGDAFNRLFGKKEPTPFPQWTSIQNQLHFSLNHTDSLLGLPKWTSYNNFKMFCINNFELFKNVFECQETKFNFYNYASDIEARKTKLRQEGGIIQFSLAWDQDKHTTVNLPFFRIYPNSSQIFSLLHYYSNFNEKTALFTRPEIWIKKDSKIPEDLQSVGTYQLKIRNTIYAAFHLTEPLLKHLVRIDASSYQGDLNGTSWDRPLEINLDFCFPDDEGRIKLYKVESIDLCFGTN